MNGPDQRIVITDLRIPFLRLVVFFVKVSLAAIPAAIIVAFLVMLLTAIIVGLLGDGAMFMRRWTY
ncbi:MAG: hypothetical protein GEU91_12490 [Rhizobiales bacterium]|nr:hypothetical protein [Hyphomicrobiales bacterium]